MNKITYISNAGVMLEWGHKKVLIDGFNNSMIPIYKSPPPDMMKKMVLGLPPFDAIDVLLFTHHHCDHFDIESTGEFLKHNRDTVVMSTCEVIDKIAREYPEMNSDRLIRLNPPLHGRIETTIKGMNITSISLLHDGKEYEDVKNLAYLIHMGGRRILHLGDAMPAEENYTNLNLAEEDIDLLIAAFPYVSIPRGRQVIKGHIKPKKIAAVHLPCREKDQFHWIESAKKSYKRVQDDFIETVFLENIGEYIII